MAIDHLERKYFQGCLISFPLGWQEVQLYKQEEPTWEATANIDESVLAEFVPHEITWEDITMGDDQISIQVDFYREHRIRYPFQGPYCVELFLKYTFYNAIMELWIKNKLVNKDA